MCFNYAFIRLRGEAEWNPAPNIGIARSALLFLWATWSKLVHLLIKIALNIKAAWMKPVPIRLLHYLSIDSTFSRKQYIFGVWAMALRTSPSRLN